MTKPRINIELKNLKLYAGLSEETQAYTADIHLDGRLIAHAKNDGHGGCDHVVPKAPFTHQDIADLEKRITAAYPPLTGIGDDPLPYTLELLCGDLIERHVTEKQLKRSFKNKVLALVDGAVSVFSYKGIKTLTPEQYAKAKASVLAKYPGATILNDLPLGEAVDLVIKPGR